MLGEISDGDDDGGDDDVVWVRWDDSDTDSSSTGLQSSK